jgi:peptidoglycan/LPS O-acetylase OafA/YrhL
MYREDDLKKYEYIDMLRGMAILGVLAAHSHMFIDNLSVVTVSICNYGQLGVQLFFVASALTLCSSATERKESSPANFYARRFFRIAPLYYFGIALYFVWRVWLDFRASGHWDIPAGYSVKAVVENIFFVHGFFPANFNFVVPGGWSIATEMAFYALFPLLFFLVEHFSLRKFALIALLIAVVSFSAQFVLIRIVEPRLFARHLINAIHVNDEFDYPYALIFNQINVFLVGMLTFRLLRAQISNWLLLLAALLMIFSCFMQNNRTLDTGFDGFFYPIFSAIAFGIIAVRLSKWRRFESLICRAIIRIGQVSFSMYITQFIILDVLRVVLEHTVYKVITFGELRVLIVFAVSIPITYLASTLTNRLIEKPGIRFGKRFTRRVRVEPVPAQAGQATS